MSDALDIFDCPNHPGNLRISTATCKTWWLKGRKAAPWDRLAPCNGCRIGARNAGFEHFIPESNTHKCVICGKGTVRRGLIFGLFCVAHSNRFREIITGKWRRDHPPSIANRLQAFTIEVAE